MRLLFSEPAAEGLRPAIFLDRDGIINERVVGDYVREWKQFRFVAGIKKLILELSKLGIPIIVVSNQSGVGKGLMRESTLRAMTRRFVSEFAEAGGRIDAVYYCPHTPDEACSCRKPQAGLLLEAAREWNIDLGRSVLIGDSISDIEAARRAHCRAVHFVPDDQVSDTAPVCSNVLAVTRMADLFQSVSALLR